MKIVFLGDIHQQINGIAKLPKDADLLIITGDFTLKGNLNQARQIFAAFQETGVRVLGQAGNMDYPEVEQFLLSQGVGLHARGHLISENIGIFGCGASAPTPFHTPYELSEEEIFESLEKGFREISKAESKIMVCHTPPMKTLCDRLPGGMHVGSQKVREFIETYQPDFCLTGHIHEGIGKDQIGRTMIVNPGPFLEGRYGILDTEKKSIQLERISN